MHRNIASNHWKEVLVLWCYILTQARLSDFCHSFFRIILYCVSTNLYRQFPIWILLLPNEKCFDFWKHNNHNQMFCFTSHICEQQKDWKINCLSKDQSIFHHTWPKVSMFLAIFSAWCKKNFWTFYYQIVFYQSVVWSKQDLVSLCIADYGHYGAEFSSVSVFRVRVQFQGQSWEIVKNPLQIRTRGNASGIVRIYTSCSSSSPYP